jgi:lipoprotein NlpI
MHPLLAWSAPQRVTSGDHTAYIDDTPAWVKPVPGLVTPKAGTEEAATVELLDMQVSLRAKEPSVFKRIIVRVTNQAEVEEASHVPVRYIPSFQKLTVHGLWVTRGDKRTSRLEPSAIRLVANEADMDQRVYRGIVTAVVFIKDLQPGDLLEMSYSISGINPVLGEHESVSVPLALGVPVKVMHARVVAPADRRFQMKVFNSTAQPAVHTEGGFTETTLLLRNVAKLEPGPQTPPEYWNMPFVQFSDFRSWQEVGDWAQKLFAQKAELPSQLQARVKEWQAHSGSALEAARLALDYVQKEIRYVSVSLGESAMRPASPDDVVRRGFGDCKDKSLLLVTLLRAMNITASPALVSTTWEGSVFDMLPSAEAFDHVIVVAQIDGRKYWLDGTNEFQAGALGARYAGDYGKALVVDAKGSSVEPIVAPVEYATGYATSHRFVITKFSAPVDLAVRATYRGMTANLMRARVQGDRSNVEKEALDRYNRIYPGVELVDGLKTRNDDKTGQLEAAMQYRIPEFFEYDEGVLKGHATASVIWAEIAGLSAKDRKTAWRLPYPRSVTHDVEIEFPDSVPLASAEPISIKDDYVAFSFRRKYEAKKLMLHFEFKTLARSVPPSAIAAHEELRKRIAKWLTVEFNIPVAAAQAGAVQPTRAKSISVGEAMLFESEQKERARTADIESGRLTAKQLSEAYLSRAWERERLGHYEEALQDATRALELNAKNRDAQETLAFDLKMLRRFDEARGQYEKAEQYAHEHYGFHVGRGQLNYYSGRFVDAQADFRRALSVSKQEDDYQHALIWLFLASTKAGADAKAEVQPYLDAMGSGWPGPAVKLFMGTMGVEGLLEAARNADETTALKRLCEAHFFIGQYYLLKGESANANRAFQQAIATDVRQYVEFVYAKWELQRTSASK